MSKIIDRQDVKKSVVAIAGERYPQEACGFIVQKAKRFTAVEVPNVHPSPLTDFKTRGAGCSRGRWRQGGGRLA